MIELKNISSGYGKKQVLFDINETMNGGEITSIVGPNGCGKSTLLETASGLMQPLAGSVLVNGEDVHKIKAKKRACIISVLSQQKNPGTLTVKALVFHGRFPYLGYPRRYTEKDVEIVENAMKTAGVYEIADQSLSALSGGQQQKAYIAMILAQDTDVVFLDEPVTFLDINYQLELMDMIKQMKNRGKTVVMVIHDLNLAMTCSDKIIAMNRGRVVCSGKPEKIYDENVFEKIFNIKTHYSSSEKQFFFSKP